MPTSFSLFRFLILVLVLLLDSIGKVDGTKQQYLYRGYNDTDPVIEFVRTEDAASVSEYPTFLNSTDNGPRVVEFYAPWCPHCQHFKPTYVQLARDVRARTTRTDSAGVEVQFYAVSCTAHGPICHDQGVKGYPSIRVFKAGEASGEKVEDRVKLSAQSILSQLGLTSKEVDEKSAETRIKVEPVTVKEAPTKEEIAASTYKRTKADVFNDASLSLDYSFRHALFMARGELSAERKAALREWLGLLKYSLPVVDMKQSHEQIDALTQQFDTAVRSEDAVKEAISHVSAFERDDWSLACTHGHPHKGYPCGLWELFHIVAVGVVESNEWQSVSNRVSTAHAADVMRNFIEHFFACEECRQNFLKMYDDCLFGRCTRLSDDASLTRERTRELPLWLWEAHNAVNVRLLHERKSRDHMPVPTLEDENSVKWPHVAECPHCWGDDGASDKGEVYSYLKREYGILNLKRPKLRQRVEHYLITHEGEFVDSSVALLSHSHVLPLAAVSLLGFAVLLRQKQKKDLVGLSKKR